MEEKRMVGDYTVLQSIRIGHKNIVLAENKKAEPNERFLCCYVEDVLVFEKYSECLVSSDYAEIAKVTATVFTMRQRKSSKKMNWLRMKSETTVFSRLMIATELKAMTLSKTRLL